MNMLETRTIRIQLKTTAEQSQLLLQTMQEYTDCYNDVCKRADAEKMSNGLELHKLTYAEHRANTHLPSQLICAARVKATESIKSVIALRKKQVQLHQKRLKHAEKMGKNVKPLKLAKTPQSTLCAIRYDARSFRFDRKTRVVSLLHVQQEGHTRNRALIPVQIPAYYEQYVTPDWHQESADLLYRKGSFWLYIVVSCAVPSVEPTGNVIGIDLGINRLAVTSHPLYFGGTHVKETNNRYFRLRRKLQGKGTTSAKRHLKKLSGRLKRFQHDANHVIAKRIVATCQPGDALVMENLTDIRDRTRERRTQRRAMSHWSFAQLQRFLAYKAAFKGISVHFIDARYTSQKCSRCGHIEKRNRTNQSEFSCRKCGYRNNADENASYNLRDNYLASRAMRVASGPTCQAASRIDSSGLDASLCL